MKGPIAVGYRGATLFVLSLLMAGCAFGGSATSAGSGTSASAAPALPSAAFEVYSRAPVTIPAGAPTRSMALDSRKWDLTSHMRIFSDASRHKFFQYVGTGKPEENEAATTVLPVAPGKAYLFSAVVDPSNIADGKFDLIVDAKDGKSSYAWVFHGHGPARRYETAPWQCPPDVKQVLLGMQLVRTSVKKGKPLRFAAPLLTEVSITSVSRYKR